MTRAKSNEIPETLRHFDQLPDSARVQSATVTRLLDVSEATLRRHIKAHAFPAPVRFGGLNYWTVGQLREVLRGKAAA